MGYTDILYYSIVFKLNNCTSKYIYGEVRFKEFSHRFEINFIASDSKYNKLSFIKQLIHIGFSYSYLIYVLH